MSRSNLFAQHFTAATWDGKAYGEAGFALGTGDYDPGDLSPPEIVRDLLHWRLTADATLASIFGAERIEQTDLGGITDYRNAPRLRVYLASIRASDLITTELNDKDVSVFVGIVFNPLDAGQTINPGTPGVHTVLHHVERVMIDYKVLPVAFGGDNRQAARSSEFVSQDVLPAIEAGTDRPLAVLETQWSYRLDVNSETGNIRQLE